MVHVLAPGVFVRGTAKVDGAGGVDDTWMGRVGASGRRVGGLERGRSGGSGRRGRGRRSSAGEVRGRAGRGGEARRVADRTEGGERKRKRKGGRKGEWRPRRGVQKS